MNALYRSLDEGGVSMLESPTGTGKTLSIICSALQWVVDQKQKQKAESMVDFGKNVGNDRQCRSDDEPDWMKNFTVNQDIQAEEKKISSRFKFDRRRNKENYTDLLSRDVKKDGFSLKKEFENLQKANDGSELNDEEFLLEEYESEEEGAFGSVKLKRKAGGVTVSSSSDEEEEEDSFKEEEEEEGFKVYFCSRTHSQLSQFVKELRKTNFANEIKVVSLGSRKNFCINEEVLRLGSSTQINERCLELQKNKKNEICKIKNLGAEGKVRRTKASSGCPMLRNHKLQKQFKNQVSQQEALDIEDLVHLGKRMGTCPYYGSRSMVPAANLVVLPYQSLLSKSSRESLGLNLKNNIVIIDEAHNLADSLISMYDAKITLSQLENVHNHIEKYFARFQNRLGPGNRRYIQTLMVLTRAFLQALNNERDESCASQDAEKATGAKTGSDSSMAINDFLFSHNIDNINLVKLLQYVKESNIILKVSGYGDKASNSEKGSAVKDSGESFEEGSILSGFRALADMLLSLTNNDGDGRVIISRRQRTCFGQQGGFLKYVMLTGEKIFSEVVNQAHAVILAGGTLQPIEETRERLFPWLPPNQLHFFSCSHIVPPESILPIAVSRGPTSKSFDFSYRSRCSLTMIEELGLLVCNLLTVVPEGIVVFFSSFDYEEKVYDAWKTSGILDRIMKKKRVFREPRKSTSVEFVLKEYKDTIDTLSLGPKEGSTPLNGAILLAVVGGKISEGINFSDGMGRCIVMVGLPYPSPSDIELLERIKYIEGLGDPNFTRTPKILPSDEYYNGDVQAGFSILRSCRRRGNEYYENLCMKAVNQSIGRAIRHINDYAAILLVDMRYASESSKRSFSHPTNKLPQWIKNSLVSSTNNYGEVHRLLHQFFKFNKNRSCP
ncbi:ATP-dependent DNA helicase DDX11 [Pistacia vera]|uniref:ATP-dependent DNA helicase DDX11 n=1 Tax=Pistacia vera TaxID=55513 RepID=UPI001263694D|nr:ATP-dependent DNA helicase DDX11 [Pistacia vera]